MEPKKPTPVLDTRYVKVLTVKKDMLKDAVVFICLDEEKYGSYDISALRKMASTIEKIEESAIYFALTKKMDVQIYDKDEFKNKDLLITVGRDENGANEDTIEKGFRQALPNAKSIDFVHETAKIARRK